MHPQLEAVAQEFGSAQARLHHLVRTIPGDRWSERVDPAGWSVAECVAHLNLTGRAFVPLVRAAIARGRNLPSTNRRRYRRDPAGWLLWRMVGPPARIRVKTTAPFIPSSIGPSVELVAEFDGLQVEQLECLRAADGLPLEQLGITSPFNARMSYNLYACLTILPRHQHRHLWQAERVWGRITAR